MEHVLIKDLRFFDYPNETILFKEELDKARMELLNYVTRLFRGKRFVFINLFGDSVDPFLAEKFIKEFIPPESIVLDEIVEYLNVPVKREFSVSFTDFSSSPLSDKCECLLYNGENFERFDLSRFKLKFLKVEVYEDLPFLPEDSLIVLNGLLWNHEYEEIKNRRNVRFVGKVLNRRNWSKLDSLLLEEAGVREEI
ncbi:MAG: hypothetical protein PWQ80_787 [Thermotoga sp.]|nr:hypothetical protein [Thermotoga sp.]MDK2950205.1 hypothetical protein [Thermotoga sp.]